MGKKGLRINVCLSLSLALSFTTLWASLFAAEEVASLPQVWDLETCIQYALAHHPELQAAESRVEGEEAAVSEAHTLFRPTLRLSYSALHEAIKSGRGVTTTIRGEDFGVATSRQGGKEGEELDDRYVFNFNLSMPVVKEATLIGMNSPSMRQSEADLEYQQKDYQTTQDTIIFEVREAFFTALKNLQEVEIARESVELSQLHYENAKARFEAEMLSSSELLSAQVELAGSKRELLESQNELALSLADLTHKIGLEPGTKINTLSQLDLSPLTLPPQEELLTLAFENNPQITAQRALIESAQANIKLVKSERWPSLSLVSFYNLVGNADPDELKNDDTSLIIGVSGSMTVFDFGRLKTRITRAQKQLEEAERTLRKVKNEVAQDVIEAYTNVLNAQAQMELLETQIEQAQEALRLAQERFAENLTTQLEVFEAQHNLKQVKTDLAQAQFDQQISYASLLMAIAERI